MVLVSFKIADPARAQRAHDELYQKVKGLAQHRFVQEYLPPEVSGCRFVDHWAWAWVTVEATDEVGVMMKMKYNAKLADDEAELDENYFGDLRDTHGIELI